MPNQERYGLLIEGRKTTVPLRQSNVEVTIQGFIASVKTTLVYRNETSDALKTTYCFPMNEMSAVYKFEAHVNKKYVVAECQEKEEAKQTYKGAIDHGHTAIFLSEYDKAADIFKCSLGNLQAGEKAVLTMSYVIELSVSNEGKIRFKLPTVLNPGYYEDPEHDPSLGRDQLQNLLTLSATVQDHRTIDTITSTIDAMTVDFGMDKRTASIKFAENLNLQNNISFDVRYDHMDYPEVLLELGNKEKDGLLKEDLLMLSFVPDFKPGREIEDCKYEFILVIDRSGSMLGERMQKAKETLLLLLKSLPVGCLFNVVSFGSKCSSLFEKSREYSEETLKEAIKLQKNMNADMGGTEILNTLKYIYSQSCINGYPRQIFLLTDGGVGKTAEVVNLVFENKKNTRVFSFGIGQDISTKLITNVAQASNGKAVFIKDNDNMQSKVISVLKSSLEVCLSEVCLDWNISGCASVFNIPQQPPCIYNGERVILFALIKSSETKAQSGELRLNGILGGKQVSYNVKISPQDRLDQELPLHRVAAKYQIKDLECDDEEDYRGAGGQNKSKIVLLSKSANIISKYTAFVGVEKESKIMVSIVDRGLAGYTRNFRELLLARMSRSSPVVPVHRLTYGQNVTIKQRRSACPVSQCFEQGVDICNNATLKCNEIRAHHSIEHVYNCRGTEVDNKRPSDSEGESPYNQLNRSEMIRLISLQHFDGSWSPSRELEKILKLTKDELVMKNQGNIWCTAVSVVYLEKNFSTYKMEWEMIVNKSIKWITSSNRGGISVEDILQQASEFLVA